MRPFRQFVQNDLIFSYLRIEIAEPVNNIEIHDIAGQFVETRHATSLQDGIINIDISHLSNGVYFVKIYRGNGILYRKLVKK